MSTEQDNQPQIHGANSAEIAQKTIIGNKKKEFQNQRQELIKKLDAAFQVVTGITGEIQELDAKEAAAVANLSSAVNYLLNK